MITLPPYLSEWQTYPLTPPKDRWIYNKLELAQRFGYDAGPVGMKVPAGEYCVRPIVNLAGMARGGFCKVVLREEGFIKEPFGYCWTPWTDDFRVYNVFINDKPFKRQGVTRIEGDTEHYDEFPADWPLPEPLRGISRYMMVETLGEMVIDAGPRHMVDEMFQEVVDDYRQFDPNYEAPVYGHWGFEWRYRRAWSDKLQAWTLEDPDFEL